jgi:ketosteroid isomerase-like protein
LAARPTHPANTAAGDVASEGLITTLTALERAFWDASSSADGDFYRRNVAADGLFVFPEMPEAIDRESCAQIVDGLTTPWAEYHLDDVRLIHRGDYAILTYRARGHRDGTPPITMRISTVYVPGDRGWLLLLHQQTLV